MGIKAVIFDLDGTLVSFNVDYRAVRAEVRDLLMKYGLPASILPLNESMFDMLKKAEIFLRNEGKPDEVVDEVRKRALAIAEKYELEAARNTNLILGATETLKTLKEMGLKIGLCTVNGWKPTDYVLRRFKIKGLFDAVTPRDEVRYVKPSTEHLEASLRALNVNPDEAVVVGDSVADVMCAKNLNVIAVGLLTEASSLGKLMNSGADYLITKIVELPNLIREIVKRRSH